MSYPIPPNEADRLEALHSLAILDTPADRSFDAITEAAADCFGVPICLVSLIDAERQWFKARVGLDCQETPRDLAFCAHTVAADELLVVPDASSDSRFAGNPLVAGEPHIRFYAVARSVLLKVMFSARSALRIGVRATCRIER